VGEGPTAALLQQLFEVDSLACPSCQGARRSVAFITQTSVLDQILTHLRTRASRESAPPTPRDHAGRLGVRGPPTVASVPAYSRQTTASAILCTTRAGVPGTATNSFTSGSLTGSAVTQVTEVPRTIALTPSTVQSLVIGRTLQTSAAVCGASGRDVPGQPVLWTSSNGRVATIASSGVVKAVAPGTMTITAAIGSLRASISVIVTSQQACAVFVRPCPAADVT